MQLEHSGRKVATSSPNAGTRPGKVDGCKPIDVLGGADGQTHDRWLGSRWLRNELLWVHEVSSRIPCWDLPAVEHGSQRVGRHVRCRVEVHRCPGDGIVPRPAAIAPRSEAYPGRMHCGREGLRRAAPKHRLGSKPKRVKQKRDLYRMCRAATVCGGRNRFVPNGGAAYGMPLNVATPWLLRPRSLP